MRPFAAPAIDSCRIFRVPMSRRMGSDNEQRVPPARARVVGTVALAVVALVIASVGLIADPPESPLVAERAAAVTADLAESAADIRSVRLEVETNGGGQRTASEGAATVTLSGAVELRTLGMMRRIVDAQIACRDGGGIDLDSDQTGEYGYLAELAGRVPVRAPVDARPGRLRLLRGIGRIEDGVAVGSGYCFRIFLPGVNGSSPPETTAQTA